MLSFLLLVSYALATRTPDVANPFYPGDDVIRVVEFEFISFDSTQCSDCLQAINSGVSGDIETACMGEEAKLFKIEDFSAFIDGYKEEVFPIPPGQGMLTDVLDDARVVCSVADKGTTGLVCKAYETMGYTDANFTAPILNRDRAQVMWNKNNSFCYDGRTMVLFTQQAPTKCTVLYDLSSRETTCQSYEDDHVDEPLLLTIDQCLWSQQYQPEDGTWFSNSKMLADDHGIFKYTEYFYSYDCGGVQTQIIGCGKADGQCHTSVVRGADGLQSSVLITDPNNCASTTQDQVTCYVSPDDSNTGDSDDSNTGDSDDSNTGDSDDSNSGDSDSSTNALPVMFAFISLLFALA